jgi:hypothetical protein
VQELQNFIGQLPFIVKNSSPIMNKIFVAGSLIFGVGSTVACMGTFDYFTPFHTNSVNLFVSMLCHLGIVVGPASMYGILSIGHTLYPKKFAELMKQNVMGFGKSQGAIAGMLGRLGFIAIVP